MGRLIVKALESLGHEVTVASRYRSWRKDGGEAVQAEVCREALAEAESIASEWERTGYRPDLFLTYHLYHKAPDWIGPALADRFDLPYAIVEASRAPKRRTGDWALGFAAADTALLRADAVAALHNADAECLSAVVPARRLSVLLPFLDAEPFLDASTAAKPLAALPLKLIAVGMMREGDKTRSYEVLAEALDEIRDLPWHLTVIGDGPAKDQVTALFAPERVTFLGAQPPEALPALYARHDLLVWPAIREAFGLVLLEAQAAGLGVIAGDTFGVPDIVRDGETGLLSAEGDAPALADNLRRVVADPALADRLGVSARQHIVDFHSLPSGAVRLEALVEKALRNHGRAVETPLP
ncbi:MAG: glycosyltransferase family 4 protein [Roseibium sp.]